MTEYNPYPVDADDYEQTFCPYSLEELADKEAAEEQEMEQLMKEVRAARALESVRNLFIEPVDESDDEFDESDDEFDESDGEFDEFDDEFDEPDDEFDEPDDEPDDESDDESDGELLP